MARLAPRLRLPLFQQSVQPGNFGGGGRFQRRRQARLRGRNRLKSNHRRAGGSRRSHFIFGPRKRDLPAVDYIEHNGLPYTLTVADLNKDGTPDLVVNNITYYGTSLWVYLGNGDGTFKSPIRNAPLYDNALSVVVADMNGDGNLDLIAGAEYGLFVILGNGNGTFQNPGPYAAWRWNWSSRGSGLQRGRVT